MNVAAVAKLPTLSSARPVPPAEVQEQDGAQEASSRDVIQYKGEFLRGGRYDMSAETEAEFQGVKPSKKDYAVAGVMTAGAVMTAVNVAAQVAMLPGLEGKLIGAGVVAASLVAGYAAADMASGVFHHWIDNYPKPTSPYIGKLAAEFQYHHRDHYSLLKVPFLSNCSRAGIFMAPMMAAVGLTNPHYAAGAFGLSFLAGGFFAQGSHRWTHTENPPALGKLMQKLHLAQTKRDHAEHHDMPWATNYCIVNGMWNPLMEKYDGWRKLENLYFKLTGAVPETWNDEATKKLALGEIDKPTFLEMQRETLKAFADHAHEKWENDYARRLEGTNLQEVVKDVKTAGSGEKPTA
ncbi:MAG: hypothetical protein AMXMBFR33_50710 [Candidatus Xenobia bacterium]